MRQRKVKDLEAKLEAVRAWQVRQPAPDVWDSVFPGRQRLARAGADAPDRGLFLEIGCGRGEFLLQKALLHPESDFIGIEGQASVVLRAMEKAERLAAAPEEGDPSGFPHNIRFVCAFVNGLEELFAPGSLRGIYLNFSDPWPKPRHAKRRLTYRGRLQDYARALQPGGFISIKTDNDALFDFTLEEIAACGWTPAAVSRDLHGSPQTASAAREMNEARQVMTEYERKFHEAGKPIHYVSVRVPGIEP